VGIKITTNTKQPPAYVYLAMSGCFLEENLALLLAWNTRVPSDVGLAIIIEMV
jgi:hypothetical protein